MVELLRHSVALHAGAAPLIQKLFKTAMRARTKQRKGERLGLGEKLAIRFAQKLIFPKHPRERTR